MVAKSSMNWLMNVSRYFVNEYTKHPFTMSDSIEQKVKDIVVEQLNVQPDQVKPEAKFIDDLGADSLDTVELVMAFEEEFGIEVPDEEAEKLVSVGDVIAYVQKVS